MVLHVNIWFSNGGKEQSCSNLPCKLVDTFKSKTVVIYIAHPFLNWSTYISNGLSGSPSATFVWRQLETKLIEKYTADKHRMWSRFLYVMHSSLRVDWQFSFLWFWIMRWHEAPQTLLSVRVRAVFLGNQPNVCVFHIYFIRIHNFDYPSLKYFITYVSRFSHKHMSTISSIL